MADVSSVWTRVFRGSQLTTKSELSLAPGEGAQIFFLRGTQGEENRTLQAAANLTQHFSSSWIVTAAEALTIVLLSMVCGMAYRRLEYGYLGNPELFLSTGMVVALLYCAGIRSVVELSSSRLGRLVYVYLMWTGVFLAL